MESALKIDTQLIHRAQEGDEEVIRALYEHYHQAVFRYLYYRVGDRQTAEDLTSEVFLRMLRFLGNFRPPSSTFPAWLFQIARNLSVDHFRKASVRDHVALEESTVPDTGRVDSEVDRKLSSETLGRALEKLTDEQRDVIMLRFIAEMPIAETAQVLDKTEDAVKGLQRRALLALRKILTEWEITYE